LVTWAIGSLRQVLGVVALDVPRIFPHLLADGDWTRLCNRAESLEPNPHGRGVACQGEWSSDIHACRILPAIGRVAMSNALSQWPIKLDADAARPASPSISFVIPHRGRERLPLLVRTIESILGQRGAEVECIVVEQSPTREILPGELPAAVRHLHLVDPADPQPWRKSWALNRGVAESSADIVVCHDGDILVPESYAAEVVHALSSGFDVAHLQRFLFCLSESDSAKYLRDRELSTSFAPERVRQNWRGGTVAIRKKAYLAIGGHDESFVGWGGEDIEFYDRCRCLRQQRFGYLPFVHLWHVDQPSKVGALRASGLDLMQQRLAVPREARVQALRGAAR
jgi:hypothetical protein